MIMPSVLTDDEDEDRVQTDTSRYQDARRGHGCVGIGPRAKSSAGAEPLENIDINA